MRTSSPGQALDERADRERIGPLDMLSSPSAAAACRGSALASKALSPDSRSMASTEEGNDARILPTAPSQVPSAGHHRHGRRRPMSATEHFPSACPWRHPHRVGRAAGQDHAFFVERMKSCEPTGCLAARLSRYRALRKAVGSSSAAASGSRALAGFVVPGRKSRDYRLAIIPLPHAHDRRCRRDRRS